MLLEAEFLAITLVLVYVGAVMVLFLFVVMMLDINLDRLREGYWDYLVPGLIVAGVMVAGNGARARRTVLRSRGHAGCRLGMPPATATHASLAGSFIPSMSIRSRLRPSSCSWRLWLPSR